MEVHYAASSSPQILSLFPQTTMETEQNIDLQASGLPGNRSGYAEYDLGSPTGAFLVHPPDQQMYPRVFQVEPPEQEVYPNVFKVDPPDQQVYPSALAEHEALLVNPEYFYSLFNNFHKSLGTRLTVPNIGGTELDLHSLYRQVTARGGLEQWTRGMVEAHLQHVWSGVFEEDDISDLKTQAMEEGVDLVSRWMTLS